jgi:hypothetical protein
MRVPIRCSFYEADAVKPLRRELWRRLIGIKADLHERANTVAVVLTKRNRRYARPTEPPALSRFG